MIVKDPVSGSLCLNGGLWGRHQVLEASGSSRAIRKDRQRNSLAEKSDRGHTGRAINSAFDLLMILSVRTVTILKIRNVRWKGRPRDKEFALVSSHGKKPLKYY
jgi:hypothetical protein